jgi:hypothetical protein
VASEVFEFLCHRHGSSLGSQVAPRRRLAAGLQELLAPWRGRVGRLLIVRVLDEGGTAYTPDELDRAEATILHFLAGSTGARLELTAAQLASGRLAFKPADGGYDIVLVIGVPAASLSQAGALVAPALDAQSGLLCLLAGGACALADLARLESELTARVSRPLRSGVQGSRHDGLDQTLHNSLISLRWGAVATSDLAARATGPRLEHRPADRPVAAAI